jgi:hypothetical protein
MRFLNKLFTGLLIGMLLCTAAVSAQDQADAVSDTTVLTTAPETTPAEAYSEDERASVPVSYNKAMPTDQQWQQITSDKAFGYKDEKEFIQKEEKPVNRSEPWIISLLLGIIRFFTSLAGHIILWGLLAILVGYVLYRILSGEGRIFARKNRKMVEEEHQAVISEEDLLESNWDDKLRAAISAGNTRMAIRYSYMRLLQILQSRDLIQYRQDKTNTAYYHELSGNAIRQEFRQLTRQYEYTWYGNYLPSSDGFETYMNTFNGVKKQLGTS